MRSVLTRRQRDTIVGGILGLVGLLVILQLWLLTATMNAYMGGDHSVVWAAAAASLACLFGNLWLLRRLFQLQRAEE
jgi:hypothetical protein